VRLVAALPPPGSPYEFGTDYVDAPSFEIKVGPESRRYSVAGDLKPDQGRPELPAVLSLLRFLRSLVPAGRALEPPELVGGGEPVDSR
jgi:hypothetical protein